MGKLWMFFSSLDSEFGKHTVIFKYYLMNATAFASHDNRITMSTYNYFLNDSNDWHDVKTQYQMGKETITSILFDDSCGEINLKAIHNCWWIVFVAFVCLFLFGQHIRTSSISSLASIRRVCVCVRTSIYFSLFNGFNVFVKYLKTVCSILLNFKTPPKQYHPFFGECYCGSILTCRHVFALIKIPLCVCFFFVWFYKIYFCFFFFLPWFRCWELSFN